MKKTSESNLERIITLLEKVESSTKSVNWWEAEMENIINKIDELEKCTSPNELKIEQLTQKLQTLIPRAKLELQIIEKLEKELEAIIKEQDEQKTKNKKSPRKKSI